jgi:hypothetical protein
VKLRAINQRCMFSSIEEGTYFALKDGSDKVFYRKLRDADGAYGEPVDGPKPFAPARQRFVPHAMVYPAEVIEPRAA